MIGLLLIALGCLVLGIGALVVVLCGLPVQAIGIIGAVYLVCILMGIPLMERAK